MRTRVYTLLALLLLPYAAHAAPSLEKIINESIKAVQKTSYTGRMKFISHMDNGQMREVKIFHVAPDLYRVEPIVNGSNTGEYFIENASELLRISRGRVMEMPRRQFSVNDALTIKFLRDIGTHPGTTVLNGQVGTTPVYMLRQDAIPSKPYVVTVGIDKTSYFPLYMMVNDGTGATRVYFEMQSIDYKKPAQISDSLFAVKDDAQPLRLPRPPEGAPRMVSTRSVEELPLYPGWLPAQYQVEAVSLLRCPKGRDLKDCATVYQLEAYGPRLTDLISIFQMRADGADKAVKQLKLSGDQGFVLHERDGWVIAVFGDEDPRQLKKIAAQLTAKPTKVRELLQQTIARDSIMDDAIR
jgi:hypothetical protein